MNFFMHGYAPLTNRAKQKHLSARKRARTRLHNTKSGGLLSPDGSKITFNPKPPAFRKISPKLRCNLSVTWDVKGLGFFGREALSNIFWFVKVTPDRGRHFFKFITIRLIMTNWFFLGVGQTDTHTDRQTDRQTHTDHFTFIYCRIYIYLLLTDVLRQAMNDSLQIC